MTSAASAIEATAFTALSAGVTLAPVYQHVPQDTPRPVVIIGDIELEPLGGKGDDGDRRGTLSIISVFEGEARKPMLDMQAEIEVALNVLSNTSGGWSVNFTLAGEDATMSETGEQYVGLSRFAVIALKN